MQQNCPSQQASKFFVYSLRYPRSLLMNTNNFSVNEKRDFVNVDGKVKQSTNENSLISGRTEEIFFEVFSDDILFTLQTGRYSP